ncbi:putative membrane protein [Halanaeroarchaeum sp. HSR-CO]|uniref:hypothetical protein n=1 Tax=Halanaeroarchaeum sp. HSR-CO TaxID=2866382 RepID=UPI00217D04A8|nr:hypothetical protein [Halanaeroarchaeum sp. HSR-CO]UWG47338.1 putative membrane protein [Halanaeroarchaeum sp. HSR-CO]
MDTDDGTTEQVEGGDGIAALGVRFDRLDRRIATAMGRLGVPTLRFALGVVFVWFGALKVIDQSPAASLVAETVVFLPPELFVPILGVWEVLIGLFFLYRPLIRVAILLLFLQLPGTFLPVVLLPEVVFQTVPYALTVEGQYIVKNLLIIGAALVVGSTVREESVSTRDEHHSDVLE